MYSRYSLITFISGFLSSTTKRSKPTMFPLSSLLHSHHRSHHRRHYHLLLFLRRTLSTSAASSSIPQSPPPSQPLQIPLSFPTYLICSSNTSVGKTLVSTGLAASFLLSTHSHPLLPPKKFLYLKPVQTGFPSDSDSRFVFSKLNSIAGRRTIRRSLLASNHVLKASRSAGGDVPLEDCEPGMFDLGSYSECRVVGEEEGEASELICKTLFAWRDAVSPHLAAEREKGMVEDSTVLENLQRCLERGLEGWDHSNVFSVIETAGGVASPGPSGTLQCDLYR